MVQLSDNVKLDYLCLSMQDNVNHKYTDTRETPLCQHSVKVSKLFPQTYACMHLDNYNRFCMLFIPNNSITNIIDTSYLLYFLLFKY